MLGVTRFELFCNDNYNCKSTTTVTAISSCQRILRYV